MGAFQGTWRENRARSDAEKALNRETLLRILGMTAAPILQAGLGMASEAASRGMSNRPGLQTPAERGAAAQAQTEETTGIPLVRAGIEERKAATTLSKGRESREGGLYPFARRKALVETRGAEETYNAAARNKLFEALAKRDFRLANEAMGDVSNKKLKEWIVGAENTSAERRTRISAAAQVQTGRERNISEEKQQKVGLAGEIVVRGGQGLVGGSVEDAARELLNGEGFKIEEPGVLEKFGNALSRGGYVAKPFMQALLRGSRGAVGADGKPLDPVKAANQAATLQAKISDEGDKIAKDIVGQGVSGVSTKSSLGAVESKDEEVAVRNFSSGVRSNLIKLEAAYRSNDPYLACTILNGLDKAAAGMDPGIFAAKRAEIEAAVSQGLDPTVAGYAVYMFDPAKRAEFAAELGRALGGEGK